MYGDGLSLFELKLKFSMLQISNFPGRGGAVLFREHVATLRSSRRLGVFSEEYLSSECSS